MNRVLLQRMHMESPSKLSFTWNVGERITQLLILNYGMIFTCRFVCNSVAILIGKKIISFPHPSTNRRAPKKCVRRLGKRTIIKWLGIADQIHFHISLGIYEQKMKYLCGGWAQCRPTTTVLSIRFNIISIVHCSVPVARVRVYLVRCAVRRSPLVVYNEILGASNLQRVYFNAHIVTNTIQICLPPYVRNRNEKRKEIDSFFFARDAIVTASVNIGKICEYWY